MSGFEFLFSFYGLLLGLAVANVTSSFADAWRSRSEWQVGTAPPLPEHSSFLQPPNNGCRFGAHANILVAGSY